MFDCSKLNSLPKVGFMMNSMTFELSGLEYVVNVSFGFSFDLQKYIPFDFVQIT